MGDQLDDAVKVLQKHAETPVGAAAVPPSGSHLIHPGSMSSYTHGLDTHLIPASNSNFTNLGAHSQDLKPLVVTGRVTCGIFPVHCFIFLVLKPKYFIHNLLIFAK